MSEFIKSRTSKAEEVTYYLVDYKGYTEEFDTQERAEARLKELKRTEIDRAADFLIAEKLFGYVWINEYGKNYLSSPHYIKRTSWLREDQFGKKEGLETDGIFYISSSDTDSRPPKYEEADNFISLISKIVELGFEIKVQILNDRAVVIISDDEFYIDSFQKKEKEFWSFGYCFQLALKEAAARLAKEL